MCCLRLSTQRSCDDFAFFGGVCSGIFEKGTQLLLFSPSLAVLSGTAFPHGLPNGVTRIFPLSVADQQQADTVNKTVSPYQPVSTRTFKCDRTRPKDGRRAATSLSNNTSGARWGVRKKSEELLAILIISTCCVIFSSTVGDVKADPTRSYVRVPLPGRWLREPSRQSAAGQGSFARPRASRNRGQQGWVL